jgi:hypothetical protein
VGYEGVFGVPKAVGCAGMVAITRKTESTWRLSKKPGASGHGGWRTWSVQPVHMHESASVCVARVFPE